MNFYDEYSDVIATLELSGGNESVGNMWFETCTFMKTTPISEIIEWASKKSSGSGKLIITIDENGAKY